MKVFDYQAALDAGMTREEIDAFLSENPFEAINKPVEQPTEDYTKYLGSPTPDTTMAQNAPKMPVQGSSIPMPELPDYVTPMTGKDPVIMTQAMGERPYYYGGTGHRGEDLAYAGSDTSLTNPIGGVTFSGYDPYGYGHYSGVIGASPEELAQMNPEDKVRMAQSAQDYMSRGQADIAGISGIAPGKNISLQGHLAQPASLGPEVATGSAQLQMGSTGHSTGPHLHQEFMDTQGQLQPLSMLLEREIRKRAGR
jgi:murein DD-endopeptidase MepM/ murein hydrolase activator NlpD